MEVEAIEKVEFYEKLKSAGTHRISKNELSIGGKIYMMKGEFRQEEEDDFALGCIEGIIENLNL